MGQISISGLFKRYETAGIIAPRLTNELFKAYVRKEVTLNKGDKEKERKYSLMGVFDDPDTNYANITFISNQDGERFSFGVESLRSNEKYLAPPPMMTLRRGKHVVTSSIERSEYQVVENFGLKSYQISFSGLLVDMAEHQYPGRLVEKVRRLFEAPTTFAVSCPILNALDIHEVFISDDFEVGFLEGYVDTVKYRFKAMATQELEIKLLESK